MARATRKDSKAAKATELDPIIVKFSNEHITEVFEYLDQARVLLELMEQAHYGRPLEQAAAAIKRIVNDAANVLGEHEIQSEGGAA